MAHTIKNKIYQIRDTVEGIVFGENIKELILDPYFDSTWPEGFDTLEEAKEILIKHGHPNREYTILGVIKIS